MMEWLRLALPVLLALSMIPGPWINNGESPVSSQLDPFSGRYPAEIIVENWTEYRFVLENVYDVDTVQPLDPQMKMPIVGEEFVPLRVVVYLDPDEARTLTEAGLSVTLINDTNLEAPTDWPTYDGYVTRWESLADAYPQLVRMINIGSSVQGRTIWCLKISDNPDLQENEPEVKFSAAIHGDELTGIELTTRLAELLVGGYGSDSRLTGLVESLETWLCPIHNPDGYVAGSRNNANGVNLNRNFPDPILGEEDTPVGREPENVAFMELGYTNRFTLGINYHGGALVVNYPWDNILDESIPVYAPDNELFYDLSLGYAELNPNIYNSQTFDFGVTVGWEWYPVVGGMQDWAYNWRDELHVTIEVSTDKNPNFSLMDNYWDDNREAMLVWMERALTGVSGIVVDDHTSLPLDAQITIDENDRTLRTDVDAGDYHRPLLPGEYHLSVAAACHLSQNTTVIVPSEGAVVQDFSLQPTGISGTLTDQATGEPISGTIRILSGTEEVVSDPATGVYHISICPGTSTLQVEAPGYATVERQVILETLLVENFALTAMPEQKIYLPTVLK